MGSRFPSHKLGNGLYVSGRPEQPKEKPSTMSSVAMPYTGGDIKKSGELGKMFDITTDGSRSRKSGPLSNAPSRTGSFGGSVAHSGPSFAHPVKKSNSGSLNKHGEPLKRQSGPQSGTAISRQNSGPLPPVLPTTGLITSGPISSGPLNSAGAPRKLSGQLDSKASMKLKSASGVHNQAVTNLSEEGESSFHASFLKTILWSMILLFVMGFIAGGFILGSVHNPILLIVVVALFAAVGSVFVWNAYWGKRGITNFIDTYESADLRTARNGAIVKVSGVITCGNVPLESSFQKAPRCVYTSTGLYEYRGWGSQAANATHRHFTWGLRSLERHVVDFYISDSKSGLRALVKTGYGAKVTPYVDESIAVDVDQSNKDLSPEFVRWLTERSLSGNDRAMRLKEGYVKEGSMVSVMGVVQRNENVLMIIPPSDPIPTGCRWSKCTLPATLDGIVLRCEDTSNNDAIPV